MAIKDHFNEQKLTVIVGTRSQISCSQAKSKLLSTCHNVPNKHVNSIKEASFK